MNEKGTSNMLVKTDESEQLLVPSGTTVNEIPRFRGALEDLVTSNVNTIELSCSNLDHVTSSHVNLLWQARMRCHENGKKVVLTDVRENLVKVLEVLDLYDEFEIQLLDSNNQKTEKKPKKLSVRSDHISLEIGVDSISISAGLTALREFLRNNRAPRDSAVEIETLFYEVVTNIRLHSGMAPSDKIKLDIVTDQNLGRLTFEDKGIGFDPTSKEDDFQPKLAAKKSQRRGFGLIMIHRMSDRMNYERIDGCWNVFTIEKYWSF